MKNNPMTGVSSTCVPVSIAETQMSKAETQVHLYAPFSVTEGCYDIAEAINILIEAGYRLGCDGELLPPRWAYEAFKGADA